MWVKEISGGAKVHNGFTLSKAVLAAIAGAIVLSGCTRDQAAERAASPPPPQVEVARVIARTVRDSEIFTDRLEVVRHVNVRPRVCAVKRRRFSSECESQPARCSSRKQSEQS